jgi:iron complex outermembrane receptor protein
MNDSATVSTRVILSLVFLMFFPAGMSLARAEQEPGADVNSVPVKEKAEDYFSMPIEELMDQEVVSSARRPQAIKRASSAVYVITAEDIRQSGATRVVDLFRLVPGMQVNDRLSFSSNVGIRGFAMHNSRMYQVLLDGRSLYDAYKGGTEEDWYPLFLEDIERIEVIRGPGGVTWGANAMNGVINIITKKPADTPGLFMGGTFGTQATQDAILRYGGTVDRSSYRMSTGAFHTYGFGRDNGSDWSDYMEAFPLTGRVDTRLDETTTLTTGGGHKFTEYQGATHISIQYVDVALNKQLSDDSSMQLLFGNNYFRNYVRDYYSVRSRESDFQAQHTFREGPHQIVWGAGYTSDYFLTKPDGVVYKSIDDPNNFENEQGSVFAEDEITLRDNLWLTLGHRSYYNQLTHYDWAGRAGLVWEAVPNHFLRTSVSRAFSRPTLQSYFIREYKTSLALEADPNERLENEHLIAYEVGYRGQLADNLDLTVDTFYNQHRDLIGQDPTDYDPSTPAKHTYVHNVLDIDGYGVETTIDYRPFSWWLVRGTHSFEHMTERNTMNEAPNRLALDPIPTNKASLTNRFYLDKLTTLNTQLFYVSKYYDQNKRATNRLTIPEYLRFDVRLARKVAKNVELAIGGTNVNDSYHLEHDLDNVPMVLYFQVYAQF